MGTVGLVGAGSVGRALGKSLGRAGIPVRYGVRDAGDGTVLEGPAGPTAELVGSCDTLLLCVPAPAAATFWRT